ncbi:isoprenylcysteine carboxylmethyltransferase family protein [Bacillus sp. FJAT-50079]|uniref:isoprenylcysteine carboxyl methyltransferase family protein n=1 Tax=Bacillus sp. FJAT-50079 TaxID=2833577 RepID=UPI0032D58B4D
MFTFFVLFIMAQRFIELRIAKSNERWMKKQGGIEYGIKHYPYMVLLHLCFFLSLIAEVFYFHRMWSPYWMILLLIFIITQCIRIWVITTLGKYWNTKIIVLPGAHIVKTGPFKYVKHPNYIIVTIELLVIPLLCQAYITAIIFFLLNQWILAVRIAAEEKALREHTNYGEQF